MRLGRRCFTFMVEFLNREFIGDSAGRTGGDHWKDVRLEGRDELGVLRWGGGEDKWVS